MAQYNIGKVIPTYKGRYKSTESYEDLDIVAYKDKSYISLVNYNSEEPSEGSTKWRIIVESPISQENVDNMNNFAQVISDKLEKLNKKVKEFDARLSKIESKLGI